jgi:NADPH2:quinone reductase
MSFERHSGRVRAATIDAPGAQPRLGWIDSPERTSGTTLLRVLAAPLNPLDLLIASGTFHSVRHDGPYVPGSECVGVVAESDRFERGAVVYAECLASPTAPGAFAEQIVISDGDILPLPQDIDPVRAAAIGNSGTAAFMSLVDVAGLKAGDTVLVLGATGAVGQLGVQIAHLSGAGRVVGVGRDRATLDGLGALGTDAVVALREGEDADSLADRIRAASGPVDVVLDGLYGTPLEAALQVCAARARVVNVGHSASPNATIPAGVLRGKQLTVHGFAGLHTPLRDKAPALTWLWKALGSGQLQVPVNTVPIEELEVAWRAQATSPHAKYVVVHPSSDESEV